MEEPQQIDLVSYWGDTLQDLDEIERSIETFYVCFMCTKNALFPTFQCAKGHSICSLCHSITEGYPFCKLCGRKSQCLPAFLQQKLALEVTMSCSFWNYGCRIRAKGRDIIRHEAHCEYSIVTCPFHDCRDLLDFANVLTHLHQTHDVEIRLAPLNGSYKFEVDRFIDKTQDSVRFCLMRNEEDSFVMMMKHKQGYFSWNFFPLHHYITPVTVELGIRNPRGTYKIFTHHSEGVFQNFNFRKFRSGGYNLRALMNMNPEQFTHFIVRFVHDQNEQ